MGIILAIISILAIMQPCLIGLKILMGLKWHWAICFMPLYVILILVKLLLFL